MRAGMAPATPALVLHLHDSSVSKCLWIELPVSFQCRRAKGPSGRIRWWWAGKVSDKSSEAGTRPEVPCRKETKTTGKCQEFSESGAGRLRAEAAVEVE